MENTKTRPPQSRQEWEDKVYDFARGIAEDAERNLLRTRHYIKATTMASALGLYAGINRHAVAASLFAFILCTMKYHIDNRNLKDKFMRAMDREINGKLKDAQNALDTIGRSLADLKPFSLDELVPLKDRKATYAGATSFFLSPLWGSVVYCWLKTGEEIRHTQHIITVGRHVKNLYAPRGESKPAAASAENRGPGPTAQL